MTTATAQKRLTAKQEAFCVNYFTLKNGTQAATLANYSPKTAYSIAEENLNKPEIQARIAELEAKAESAAIGTVVERKRRLTEIYRATVGDFVDENGNLDIKGKDKLNTPAVAEIKTERTVIGIKTTLKLRDPIAAIQEQNKMERIGAQDINIHNQNILVEVVFRDINSGKAKDDNPDSSSYPAPPPG